ncbi:MAG: GyrI-like domain-containing protein [Hyphomicrobiales bacterium]
MTINKDIENRIQKVLTYIHYNIGEKHKLKELADIGNISQFHFHRLVRAYLNEPLGSYIKRTKLEAAFRLLQHSKLPITDIAYKMGYDTIASFSKAFKLHYNVSPQQIRDNHEKNIGSETLNHIFHLDSDQEIHHSLVSETPIIKEMPDMHVAYVFVTGKYGGVNTHIAWEKINAFAVKNNINEMNTHFYGICYDSPLITEENKIRYEACVTIDAKNIKHDDEVHFKVIPQGRVAVFRHKGPYEGLEQSIKYIMKKWLPQSNEILREDPSMDEYVNCPQSTPREELITDVHIPIE